MAERFKNSQLLIISLIKPFIYKIKVHKNLDDCVIFLEILSIFWKYSDEYQERDMMGRNQIRKEQYLIFY